jgi:hypothetical protein
LEDVTVHAGYEVLKDVDNTCVLIVGNPRRILALSIIYYYIILATY